MIQAIGESQVSGADAVQAVRDGVAICDRSHWGRIEISDSDRLAFLHNQSTNHIKRLQPGQGCETVIINSTARTIDLVSVYSKQDSLLLLVSPGRDEHLMQWFDRYIFFQDKIKLANLTESTGTISLIGPKSSELLTNLDWELPDELHHHTSVEHDGSTITIAKGSGLASEGFTLFFDCAIADALGTQLVNAGATPIGESAWENLRISEGRPKVDAELTDKYNPLEACLWHLVSFNKGCYIGQEIIARLDTYDGVKQKLWGLESSAPLQVNDSITQKAQKVGVVTSVDTSGQRALAYVKTRAGGEGDQVQVGEAIATLTEVPFLTREKA
ncbi:MAG: folate-binding protein [Cyanobacteria bacterium P01_F01_bin.42]